MYFQKTHKIMGWMINLHQFSGCLDDFRLRQQHETVIFGNHRNDYGIYGSRGPRPHFQALKESSDETWKPQNLGMAGHLNRPNSSCLC